MKDVNKIMDDIPDEFTIGEVVDVITKELTSNKKAILHLWKSIGRDIFEIHLMKFCEYTIERYVESRRRVIVINENNTAVLIDYLKCEFFGQLINWLNNRMAYDLVEHAEQLTVFIDSAIAVAEGL